MDNNKKMSEENVKYLKEHNFLFDEQDDVWVGLLGGNKAIEVSSAGDEEAGISACVVTAPAVEELRDLEDYRNAFKVYHCRASAKDPQMAETRALKSAVSDLLRDLANLVDVL